jgi:hypothetical protein
MNKNLDSFWNYKDTKKDSEYNSEDANKLKNLKTKGNENEPRNQKSRN